MSNKGLIVIDGSQLSAANTSIPEDISSGMSAEQFFELGNSRISECIYRFVLPPTVTFGFQDIYNFNQLLEEDPQRLLQDYFDVIASRLKADPIVVSILDGNTILPYLENEDSFETLVGNLFTEVDWNEEGEINKSQMKTALIYFGAKIGVTSFSDLPMIDDILKKHGVDEGEEKVDQVQFATLIKPILQDIANDFATNPVTVQRDVKIANGGIPKQLLEEESILIIFGNLLYQLASYSEEDQSFADVIKNFFKENATTYGIPPFNVNDEAVVRLYDAVFSKNEYQKKAIDLEKDEVEDFGKKVLQDFATQLEAQPLFYGDATN